MARRQRGEGSVFYDEGRGLWVGRVELEPRNGKRRRRVVYAKTQKAAIAKMRDVRRDVDKGVTTTRSMALEAWLTKWIDEVVPGRVKPKTFATYRSYVRNYIVPAIGRVKLDRLNAQHVRDLHAFAYSKGATSTTAGHAHRILGTALAEAMTEDLVGRNVAAIVAPPTKQEAQRRPLTLEEFVRFMRVVENDRLASRWMFGFMTGSRQGEVLGLRWESVDLDTGLVDLATQLQRIPYKHGCERLGDAWACGRKRADRCPLRALDVPPGMWHVPLHSNLCLQRPKTSGSTRVVPLPAPLVEALRLRRAQYEAERPGYDVDHGLVWCEEKGQPIDGEDDRLRWHEHLKAAGIPSTDQHSMRHTSSTIFAALKVPEHVRMAILGHSEEATNRRYTHVDLSAQREAMELYGAAFTRALSDGGAGR